MKANHLRRGMVVKYEADLWRVFDAVHQTPGNLRARVQTKLKNLRNGVMKDVRFRSEDDVEKAHLETARKEFLYRDADGYHFMDVDTYEQIVMTEEMLGDAVGYMQANMVLEVLMHEGTPVGIELPATVDLQVVETAPALKGATASAQRKPATLETGLVVQVPPFIADGETIRVRTEDGQYVERA